MPAVLAAIQAEGRTLGRYPLLKAIRFHSKNFDTPRLANAIQGDIEALDVHGALPVRVVMGRITNCEHHVKKAKGASFCTAVMPKAGERLVLGKTRAQ